jgi:hypothetical protein
MDTLHYLHNRYFRHNIILDNCQLSLPFDASRGGHAARIQGRARM